MKSLMHRNWVLMWFKLKTKIISTTSLVVVVFFSPFARGGSDTLCSFQEQLYQTSNRFFKREQYLLSSVHYSSLFHSPCSDIEDKSRFNYSLAMSNLGEISEVVEQYRFFRHTKKKGYRTRIKTLLDFSTSNNDNERVKLWNHLGNKNMWDSSEITKNDQPLQSLQYQYINLNSQKNPLIAGVASAIIPGLGQAYNGLYQSAAISFIFTSLFLWSTYDFQRKDMSGATITSGLVFMTFYTGNIINAIRGSHRINKVNSHIPREQIKKRLFPELNLIP